MKPPSRWLILGSSLFVLVLATVLNINAYRVREQATQMLSEAHDLSNRAIALNVESKKILTQAIEITEKANEQMDQAKEER